MHRGSCGVGTYELTSYEGKWQPVLFFATPISKMICHITIYITKLFSKYILILLCKNWTFRKLNLLMKRFLHSISQSMIWRRNFHLELLWLGHRLGENSANQQLIIEYISQFIWAYFCILTQYFDRPELGSGEKIH